LRVVGRTGQNRALGDLRSGTSQAFAEYWKSAYAHDCSSLARMTPGVYIVITEYELYSDERKDTPRGFLIVGGVVCTDHGRERLLTAMRNARNKHGLHGEIHWKKTSDRCLSGYMAWLDAFFDDPHARFSMLTVDRSSSSWRAFCASMRRKSNHDNPLASVFYQFLLTTFGPLRTTKRWWVFPDAGYFSRDSVLKRVEFLFNRTYKRAFGPKTSRIIRLAHSLDSKRSDIIQLADNLLACSTLDNFALPQTSSNKRELLKHFKARKDSVRLTSRDLEKIAVHSWVAPHDFQYSQRSAPAREERTIAATARGSTSPKGLTNLASG
jgi:hypothetical protein